MGEWTFTCWACQSQTPVQERVRRTDSCPKCLADMHACKNCRFFSPFAHNQCTEVIAEHVTDKERSNFCGMYEALGDVPHKDATDLSLAKAKLAALFAK